MKLAVFLAAVFALKGSHAAVIELTPDTFESTLAPVDCALVAATATWCGHCQSMKPAYAAINHHAPVFNVDLGDRTPASSAIAQKMGVKGFPSVFLYEYGVQTRTYEGHRSTVSFESFLNDNCGTVPKPPPTPSMVDIDDALPPPDDPPPPAPEPPVDAAHEEL